MRYKWQKKNVPLAYVPYVPPPSQELLNTLSNIQLKVIPPYADIGVQYQRYSKKEIGNNEYQLIYQEVKTAIVTISATATAQNSNIILNGKSFYLSEVVFSSRDTTGLAAATPPTLSIGVREGVAGTFTSKYDFPYLNEANGTSEKVIQLRTPIKMSGNVPASDLIAVKDSAGGANMKISLVGWLE